MYISKVEVSHFEDVDDITKKLNMIWDAIYQKMGEESEKIHIEVEILIERLLEEKFKKLIEINQKYELELKDLEVDVDFGK